MKLHEYIHNTRLTSRQMSVSADRKWHILDSLANQAQTTSWSVVRPGEKSNIVRDFRVLLSSFPWVYSWVDTFMTIRKLNLFCTTKARNKKREVLDERDIDDILEEEKIFRGLMPSYRTDFIINNNTRVHTPTHIYQKFVINEVKHFSQLSRLTMMGGPSVAWRWSRMTWSSSSVSMGRPFAMRGRNAPTRTWIRSWLNFHRWLSTDGTSIILLQNKPKINLEERQ